MPAIIIVYVWKTVGYAAVIFLAGLQGIPKELYEAARVDGANAWAPLPRGDAPGSGADHLLPAGHHDSCCPSRPSTSST